MEAPTLTFNNVGEPPDDLSIKDSSSVDLDAEIESHVEAVEQRDTNRVEQTRRAPVQRHRDGRQSRRTRHCRRVTAAATTATGRTNSRPLRLLPRRPRPDRRLARPYPRPLHLELRRDALPRPTSKSRPANRRPTLTSPSSHFPGDSSPRGQADVAPPAQTLLPLTRPVQSRTAAFARPSPQPPVWHHHGQSRTRHTHPSGA